MNLSEKTLRALETALHFADDDQQRITEVLDILSNDPEFILTAAEKMLRKGKVREVYLGAMRAPLNGVVPTVVLLFKDDTYTIEHSSLAQGYLERVKL